MSTHYRGSAFRNNNSSIIFCQCNTPNLYASALCAREARFNNFEDVENRQPVGRGITITINLRNFTRKTPTTPIGQDVLLITPI